MSTIALRFCDLGWPLISPVISAVTGHWSNHVDLLIDDRRMITAMPGGVYLRPIASLPAARSETVEVPCTTGQRVEAIDFALGQLGKGYDYAGVLFFKLAPSWQDDHRWFCSELTAAALQHAGIISVPKGLHRVSPAKLYAFAHCTTV